MLPVPFQVFALEIVIGPIPAKEVLHKIDTVLLSVRRTVRFGQTVWLEVLEQFG